MAEPYSRETLQASLRVKEAEIQHLKVENNEMKSKIKELNEKLLAVEKPGSSTTTLFFNVILS